MESPGMNSMFPSLQPPLPGHGQGRLIALDQPVTVATAVQKMKSHLGLSHLRLALGSGRTPGNEPSRHCTAVPRQRDMKSSARRPEYSILKNPMELMG